MGKKSRNKLRHNREKKATRAAKAPEAISEIQKKIGFFASVRNIFANLFTKKQDIPTEKAPETKPIETQKVETQSAVAGEGMEPEDKKPDPDEGHGERMSKAEARWRRKRDHKDRIKAAEEAKRLAEEANRPKEPTFEELLEESWDEEAVQAAIKKKAVGQREKPQQRRRITAKQRLRHIENQDEIPTIDLHGHFREDAAEEVKELIENSKIEGSKIEIGPLACIITGKGLGSNGKPVIRPLVRRMLEEYLKGGTIKSFKNAPPKLGGEGAFVVEL